jgi:hypothetical protein
MSGMWADKGMSANTATPLPSARAIVNASADSLCIML